MYTKNQKQFSIKTTIKWSVLSEHFEELTQMFTDKIENLFKVPTTVSVKKFRSSSTARFTVILKSWHPNPDVIDSKVETVVQETIDEVTKKYKFKNISKLYA